MTDVQQWKGEPESSVDPGAGGLKRAEQSRRSSIAAPSLYLIDDESRVWATELRLSPEIDLHTVREMSRMGVT